MSAIPETDICYSQRTNLAKVNYSSKAKAEQARIQVQSKTKRKLEVYKCPLNGGNHYHLRTRRSDVKRWDGSEVQRLPAL